MTGTRVSGRDLVLPALWALALALILLYAVGFDQGTLASPVTSALSDKGGVLHEFFHDGRHLLGIPCH
jgi:hypothetical protein